MSPLLPKRLTRLGLTAVLLITVLSVFAVIMWVGKSPRSIADAAPPADLTTLEAMETGFTWIAESVKPAVVFIEAEQAVTQPDAGPLSPGDPGAIPPDAGPDSFRDWFREFFGPDAPMPRSPRSPRQAPQMPAIGQGSGVVVDPEGYIVTNDHVVGNATKINVHLPSGETYSAELLGTDKLSDLAVIKIEPDHPLVAAKLGDAGNAKVGSWAMAIGYPFGGSGLSNYGGGRGRFDEPLRYEPTVTVGIVSALDRQIESEIQGRPFRHLIQTDAPINPGSSGGPLLNIRAEVIGINQAIFTNPFGGGNIGVGFAIPINARNKEIIESLKQGETVVRGQLGVEIMPVTPSISQIYGADHGVFITHVYPDTPAARGGLKDEDIILKYNGKKVTSQDEFVGWVMETTPGKTVRIDILRDGEPVKLDVKVEALSLDVAERQPPAIEKDKLGLTVVPIPEDRGREVGAPEGVLVREANPAGDGSRAGIRPGDVITKINRRPVTDPVSYRSVVKDLEQGDPVVIRLWRRGRVVTAQIEHLSE